MKLKEWDKVRLLVDKHGYKAGDTFFVVKHTKEGIVAGVQTLGRRSRHHVLLEEEDIEVVKVVKDK